MEAKDSFLSEFSILSQAGVGVFIVRTREPHRVRHVLMSYAFGIGKGRKEEEPFHFGAWDRVLGWRIFTPEDGNPKGDQDTLALNALGHVAAVNAAAATAFKDGVYLMENMHPDFQDPQFLQLIKHYAHEVTGDKDVTIVLTVPEGTAVPMEIEDDVKILTFSVPSQGELEERTKAILTARKEKEPQPFKTLPLKEGIIRDLAQAGRGLSLLDYEHALDRGVLEHVLSTKKKPSLRAVVRTILGSKVDVVKRSQVLELIPPSDLAEMGGYGRLKSHIKDFETAFSQEARDYGIDPPKGILLVGVQGTGKSLAARSVGSILKLNTVRFDIGRCFGQYVGESESRAESALDQIISMAPVVAWIDEIDKGGFGGGGDSAVSDRVLAKILTKMQENGKNGIFWVMSANRVGNIPPELIRKGRLDEVFFLGLPTTNERREVFNIHLTKRGHDPKKVIGLEKAVVESEGFIPAEIESIVNTSLLAALKLGKDTTTGSILCAKLKATVPMSKAHAKDVQGIINWGSLYAVNASDDEEQVLKPDSSGFGGNSGAPAGRKLRAR